MRTFVFAVAMLCTAAVLAPQTALAQQPATSAAAPTQQRQMVQRARPLHHHPTLFGMLQRNNRIRARAGLGPHRMNAALTAAAQNHANYMAATGQFSHYTNGGPQQRAARFGFRGGVRENIAMNGGSADHAFQQWTASGAHYASIVSGTTDAGFGYAVGRNGMGYYVGVYGTAPRGYAGETEEQIFVAYQAEGQADQETEAAVATDSNVTPASANMEVKEAAVGGQNGAGT